MSKTVIIAICGKSASGKDTLAKYLYKDLKFRGEDVNLIKSYTSRPPRKNEDDSAYRFLTANQFLQYAIDGEFLEYTKFRGWYYGTPMSSIKEGYINIGVFNNKGIESLIKIQRQKDIVVIPFYLKVPFSIRMRRSYERESKWRFEYLRRAIVDFFDFIDISATLKKFNKAYVIDGPDDTVLRRVRTIEKVLEEV